MKQLKNIFLVLGVALLAVSCGGKDDIDQRLAKSKYFVTFDTKSGMVPTLNVTENKDILVAVTVGATKGASMTVDFKVNTPSTTDPASALYDLFNLDGTPMTSTTLTFPEGTGAQSFLFRARDNELTDGKRTFELELTDNSAGYTVGVNKNGEGKTIDVTVTDDDHPLKAWTGIWTILEENGSAPADWAFDVNVVGGAADNQLIISDFPVYSGVTLNIPMTMDVEAGTVTVEPILGIPSGYGAYRLAQLLNMNTDDETIAAQPLEGVINENGTILLNGTMIFEITDGANAGIAFSYYTDMLFTR